MYRKYRKGELPDIQIPPSALIAPLQAVAFQDNETAKILFTSLLTSIRKQITEKQGQDGDFSTRVNSLLASILDKSKLRSNCCLAAIMEYLWTNDFDRPLEINPERIVHLAKATKLQQLAILLLENQRYLCSSAASIFIMNFIMIFLLTHSSGISNGILGGFGSTRTGTDRPSDSKKPRREDGKKTDQERRHDNNWFCVANLYGDIKDVDSMRAVVAHLSYAHENTKKAVESESKHDWTRAIQFYRFFIDIVLIGWISALFIDIFHWLHRPSPHYFVR